MTGGRQLAAALLLLAGCATTTSPMLDLKITKGRILDGTGAPWVRADIGGRAAPWVRAHIGVRGHTIVSIGDLANEPSKTTIDAQNHIVSPGFIDLLGQDENAVFRDPHLEPKIRQGVTTELTGEGGSPRPSLRDFFEKLQKNGTAVNFALLVGASNPREMVIGNVNRKPTAQEMAEMEKIVDQEMRNGAVGLSTSLIYLPAMLTRNAEIIIMAK